MHVPFPILIQIVSIARAKEGCVLISWYFLFRTKFATDNFALNFQEITLIHLPADWPTC